MSDRHRQLLHAYIDPVADLFVQDWKKTTDLSTGDIMDRLIHHAFHTKFNPKKKVSYEQNKTTDE